MPTASPSLATWFLPGDRIRFHYQGATTSGRVIQLHPKRALVVTDDDRRFRVPYRSMTWAAGKQVGLKRATRLTQIAKTATELMNHHGLHDWCFKFDVANRRLGKASSRERAITLSTVHALQQPHAEVRDTVLHEIAHALVGNQHGHDRVWREKALAIGCSGKVTAPGVETEARYIRYCSKCKWKQKMHRRGKQGLCATCRTQVTYVPYSPKQWDELVRSHAAAGRD